MKKSSTCFSWLFGHIEKNNLISTMKLISKLLTPQPGLQTIAIHILANISGSKTNKNWNWDSLWCITREMVFFKNHVENEAGNLVPDLFCFLKSYYKMQKPVYCLELRVCL